MAPAKPASQAAYSKNFPVVGNPPQVGSARDRNPIPARLSSRFESAEAYIAGNHIAAALPA